MICTVTTTTTETTFADLTGLLIDGFLDTHIAMLPHLETVANVVCQI